MGCDIHMYVEYRERKKVKPKNGEEERWKSFGDRINPGRDYRMFTILAGVRGQSEYSLEPKGKIERENMGYSSRSDAFLYITEDPTGDGSCNRETAEKYVSYGCKIIDNNWVEYPDWHSHSWLSTEEFREALERYKILFKEEWGSNGEAGIEYKAILSAMEALEDGGTNESRLVFWFDN